MFEQSLLDQTAFDQALYSSSSWSQRACRGWTTFTAFGVQVILAGALVLLPLLRQSGLPLLHQLSTPVSLGAPYSEVRVAAAHEGTGRQSSDPAKIVFKLPSALPTSMRAEISDGPPGIPSGPFIPGSVGSGESTGVRDLLAGGSRPIVPAVPPAPVRLLRISKMLEGDLIRKIQPTYPALARSARIQGAVVLQALISKQGTIENLKILSGHPMLVPAAIDAVKQWRYRPYILNNEPVEVETEITVNFSLAGN